ncbi:MAG TPA: LytTR family DNA-binding domain-containing protein, partial [Chthonomonadaceae bacterium]|nr:LytTR family DNA-binding domain-containing protein [Chthonomonadaceae bacterium]
KRVVIRTPDGEKRTYYTLAQLETMLPADRFLRIHDSCIVNLEQIRELHSLGSHSYAVSLIDGARLPVSRSRYPKLQRRLGLASVPGT